MGLTGRTVPLVLALAAGLACVLAGAPADAACNLIPGTTKTFGGVLGAANRPFAAPGELVELRFRGCEATKSAFLPAAGDHLVTLAFKPAGGTPRLVVLAPDCAQVPVASCGPTPTVCRSPGPMLAIDPDLGDRRLRFILPDTDALLAPAGDGIGLAGPVGIAVTGVNDPLPCGLATSTCAAASAGTIACIDELYDEDGACGTTSRNDVFPGFTALPNPNVYSQACFTASPPCDATATTIRASVDAEGNLLAPFVWQNVLVRDAGVPVPRLLRARIGSLVPLQIPDRVFLGSFTPEGGRLPPILEPQADAAAAAPDVVTLFGSVDAPYTILRFGRRHGTCIGGPNDAARCGRDADCPGGACRTSCVDAPAVPCTTDGQCPSGRCGVLVDASPLVAGGGPLVLPRLLPKFCQLPPNGPCAGPADCPGAGNQCVSYALEAQNPVPLEGLAASDAARTFSVRESIDATDRNGDGDVTDTVVTVRDRATGLPERLGAPAGCNIPDVPDVPEADRPEGRAVVRVNDAPFTFPAVAVEDDVVAFLESEASEKYCDENGDGDRADAILRVFRLGQGELTADLEPPRAVDATPRIDRASIAVSKGRVFVRSSEAGMAKQTTERVSIADDESEADGPSKSQSISDDGRYVAFESDATNLLSPLLDTNDRSDVFLRDRLLGTTRRVSIAADGSEANGSLFGGPEDLDSDLAGDASAAAWKTRQTNLLGVEGDNNGVNDVFVRDLTEPTTTRVSEANDGTEADFGSSVVGISADGRFVAFGSLASTLLGPEGDTNGSQDVFVADRCVSGGIPLECIPSLERIDVRPDGSQSSGGSVVGNEISLSADGRYVVWTQQAEDLLGVENDTNGAFADVFVRDRWTGTTEVGGLTVLDQQPPTGTQSAAQAISGDGRFVAFDTADGTVLGPGGDTNGASDVFVRDRLLRITQRVSVATGGRQLAGGNSFQGALSRDGRYVAFVSTASDVLGPGVDTNGTIDAFVHDRVTGTTDRVSVAADGSEAVGGGTFGQPRISADGRYVAFATSAANLLGPGGDGNGAADIFVRGPDRSDPNGIDELLFPNGELDDVVLETFDASAKTITTLCPAGDVSVADGNAAFLRPESEAGTAQCPAGSLNAAADADLDDQVVQLSIAGGTPLNLGRAATAVGLSAELLAALVSESGDGLTDYNDDHDELDGVVQTHAVGGGAWTNVGQAADTLAVAGHVAAFITPEAAQGDGPLNGDADATDRVIQVWDAGVPRLVPLGQAAEEMVLGQRSETVCGERQLLAFRTGEAAQSDGPLNGDGDVADAVMQVYDVVTDTLFATGQAATPCRLEACDPRLPYRVSGEKVTFLTFESEQGEDLDGNGTSTGLVIQSFDACTGAVTVIGTVDPDTTTDPLEEIDEGRVFTAPGGRCATTPAASCDPTADTCPAGAFCNQATSRCTLLAPATCTETAPCPDGAECVPQLVTVATSTADRDGDGVADDVDDCPDVPDPQQIDSDHDGVGDVCDVTAGCSAEPRAGCRLAPRRQSQMTIYDRPDDRRDFLNWTWQRGATPRSAFGDPTHTDGFAMCLYDGPAKQLVFSSAVAPGRMCTGSLRQRRAAQPCWTATRAGYRYENGEATPLGLTRITLQATTPERSRIRVRGEGVHLPSLRMPLVAPIVAQLQGTNGECWEATFDGAGVQRNDAAQVRAENK